MAAPGTPRRTRLVATDLDGTLLGRDSRLSERTIAALRRAEAAGMHLVAATGRSHRTALPLVAPAGVFAHAVCSNGAVAYDIAARRVVDATPIDDAVTDAVAATVTAGLPGAGLAWESQEGFGLDRTFAALRPDTAAIARAHGAVSPRGVVKVMVAHAELTHDALLDALRSLLDSEVTVETSGAGFVEITAAGVDKAYGLARLCERLDRTPDEVLAFGDQPNDEAMLRWAGRGVAMANAHPRVLAVADEQAGHHADDGVAEVLETLFPD